MISSTVVLVLTAIAGKVSPPRIVYMIQLVGEEHIPNIADGCDVPRCVGFIRGLGVAVLVSNGCDVTVCVAIIVPVAILVSIGIRVDSGV